MCSSDLVGRVEEKEKEGGREKEKSCSGKDTTRTCPVGPSLSCMPAVTRPLGATLPQLEGGAGIDPGSKSGTTSELSVNETHPDLASCSSRHIQFLSEICRPFRTASRREGVTTFLLLTDL